MVDSDQMRASSNDNAQIFLDILTISRHIPESVEIPNPKLSSKQTPGTERPNLGSAVLDTLLCVLVDSPAALRCFEEIGGLDTVVRTLKRSDVSKDDR